MWRAAQHSLHLGSEIEGINAGRPLEGVRGKTDTIDYLLTWDPKCHQLMFT